MTNTTSPITTAATVAPQPLLGRTAVVTGATSGIGEATARALAAAGASVALVGRRADRLETITAELTEAAASHATGADGAADPKFAPVAADLTEPGAAARVAEQVRAALGPVDLVVANAGVMLPAPFERGDLREWDQMLDLNVRALIATGHAFADDLLAAGAAGRPADLVHVGSIASHVTFPNYAVYGATKAAIIQLTRNLRIEWGSRGVRVRNVEPGFTLTELPNQITDAQMSSELSDLRDTVGDANMLQAADLADAITYTVSAPAHVNVAELVVVPTVQG